MTLEQQIAGILVEWPWAPDAVPRVTDIQQQLCAQGASADQRAIVVVLGTFAVQRAILLRPGAFGTPGVLARNTTRLRAIIAAGPRL